MKTTFTYNRDIALYYERGFKYNYLIWELLANANRVINSVYIFKHFDEYCTQLQSDRNEDKQDVYWNASYYEKLIDYIKIVLAFETLNKASLLKKGILIHKIDSKVHKALAKRQTAGFPITLEEFYSESCTYLNWRDKEAKLNGLVSYYPTINFSHTLNENYQEILQLDPTLRVHLSKINQRRNRLHLYSDFTGAFEVSTYINKWKFIRESSLLTIRREFEMINDEMKKLD